MNGEATVQAAWSDDWCVQYGGSCLDIACGGGHIEVVKYLVDVGGKELVMFQRYLVSAWAGSAAYAGIICQPRAFDQAHACRCCACV